MRQFLHWMGERRSLSGTIGYIALITAIGLCFISSAYNVSLVLAIIGAFFLTPLVFGGHEVREIQTRIEITDMQKALNEFPSLWEKIEAIRQKAGVIEVVPNGGKKLIILRDGKTIAYVFVKRGKYDVAWAKVSADQLMSPSVRTTQYVQQYDEAKFVDEYLNSGNHSGASH